MQVANISCNKDSSMAVKILMVKSLFNLPEVSPPLYTLKTCQYLYVTLVNITGQTCSLALLHTTYRRTLVDKHTDSKQGQAATWRLGLLINWTKMLCTQFIKEYLNMILFEWCNTKRYIILRS